MAPNNPGAPATRGAAAYVGLDQHLDVPIPQDAAFHDETGKAVRLGDYFGKRPVLINLIFYKCAAMCTLELDGMVASFRLMDFTPGREFEVVTISINPSETPALAAAKKQTYLQAYGKPEAARGWHFLTGSIDSIQKVADAIGYRYSFDATRESFMHPAGITLCTPEGRTSQYFYGVNYSPRDLRLALVAASSGQIGTVKDAFLLLCSHYDPATGRYTLLVNRILQITAALTVLAFGVFMITMWRWERRRARLSLEEQLIAAEGREILLRQEVQS